MISKNWHKNTNNEIIKFNLIFIKIIFNYLIIMKIYLYNGDWGLGIGDWGLGIGDWAIPNPQSPLFISKN